MSFDIEQYGNQSEDEHNLDLAYAEIKELQKENALLLEVVDVVKEQIKDSYYGHEEVNLTPAGRAAIEEAIAKYEGEI